MTRPASLLVAGTASNAGKSLITTGLCRAFARRGVSVAPFKAQNMSNNSTVIRSARYPESAAEIGRAQWVQALAAYAEPEEAMSPVLLKPDSLHGSRVVLMGQAAGHLEARDFRGGREQLQRTAYAAFDDLTSRFDIVVCEGAGSPAEINLRESDYVNMGLAQHGQIPTILVGDIDRGGVFASLYGTLALLDAQDQRLISGFIINKFRGDASLLEPALERITQLSSRPFFGVVPWHDDVWIDAEDGLSIPVAQDTHAALHVRVVAVPRAQNITDADALGVEPGVDVRFVTSPRDCGDADLIILPGSTAPSADLTWLRSRGLDSMIQAHADAGKAVLGIGAGLSTLGRSLHSPAGTPSTTAGLGLLSLRTTLGDHPELRVVHGHGLGNPVSGYEIQHGHIEMANGDPFPGGARNGQVFGTAWHGTMECDQFRRAFLTEIVSGAGIDFQPSDTVFSQIRHARLDLLSNLIESHVDVDRLWDLAYRGAT